MQLLNNTTHAIKLRYGNKSNVFMENKKQLYSNILEYNCFTFLSLISCTL